MVYAVFYADKKLKTIFKTIINNLWLLKIKTLKYLKLEFNDKLIVYCFSLNSLI